MKKEILALAEECGLGDITLHGRLETKDEALEAFGKAMYNKGLMDARNELHKHDDDYITERAILALEMKK
jgi:hypothetical protein